VFGGRLADAAGHLERLWRSLSEIRIRPPMSEAALMIVMRETVRRNRVTDGAVYLQITRGTAPRDHAFPHPDTPPSVVVTARRVDFRAEQRKADKGVAVITQPDNRWGRCDIKTVGLLPNALAKQAAREQGAYEAWLVDDLGFVTEGASTNAWIVDAGGTLRTRDTNANILRGITRKTLIDLIGEAGLEVSLRPFTVEEAKAAKEAFITAASTLVLPVIRIDGATVGDGRPGPVGRRLRVLYEQNARETAL
jgi:D-alanine transaminase